MAATVRLRAGLAAPIPYDLITDRRSIFMHRGVGNDMGDLGVAAGFSSRLRANAFHHSAASGFEFST